MTQITSATVEHCQVTPWNKTANRRWQAEWITDQESGEGVDFGYRLVTLSASHHDGAYIVRAGIATRVSDSTPGFTVTRHEIFKDPLITLYREQGRFGQKRLKEIFDRHYQEFDAEAFYAAHEVEPKQAVRAAAEALIARVGL